MHAVNVFPLVAAHVIWFQRDDPRVVGFAASAGLGELVAYISGVCCRIDMGLTVLPLARESPWLNAAGLAYPEAIPFHRVTGWWCVAQTRSTRSPSCGP